MSSVYESVLCVKNEVFVYRIPARSTNRGYRAAEWKLDQPDWVGRLRVVAVEKELFLKLEDKGSGELFAKCPVEGYPGVAVEQVLDSCRYFVIRIKDESGRTAFIGIGFADRGDSFDLLVTIQDHFKWVKRETKSEEAAASFDPGPQLDLGFKEGQTIRINIGKMKAGEEGKSTNKPRPAAGGISGGLLPPPPGGVKLPGPSGNAGIKPVVAPPSVAAPAAASNSVSNNSNLDLLADLSAPPPAQPLQSQPMQTAAADPWGDFTQAASAQNTSSTANTGASNAEGGWVQF